MNDRCKSSGKNYYFTTPKNLQETLAQSTCDRTNQKSSKSKNRRNSSSQKQLFFPKSCLKNPKFTSPKISKSNSRSKSGSKSERIKKPSTHSPKKLSSKTCINCSAANSISEMKFPVEKIKVEDLPFHLKEKVRKIVIELANEKEKRIQTHEKLTKERKKNEKCKNQISELKKSLAKALRIIEIFQEPLPEPDFKSSLPYQKRNAQTKNDENTMIQGKETPRIRIHENKGDSYSQFKVMSNTLGKEEGLRQKAYNMADMIMEKYKSRTNKKAKVNCNNQKNMEEDNDDFKTNYDYKETMGKNVLKEISSNTKRNNGKTYNVNSLLKQELNKKAHYNKAKENFKNESFNEKYESDLSVLAIEEKIKDEYLKMNV